MDAHPPRHGAQRSSLTEKASSLRDVDVMPSGPAELPALSPCAPQSGKHSLSDEIPLELRDRCQHVEQQTSGGCRRINALVEDDQVDAESLQLCRQSNKVPRASREPIQFHTRHDVYLAGPGSRDEGV